MAFSPLHLKWGLFQQFEKLWIWGLHNLLQVEVLMGPRSRRTQLLSKLVSLLNLTLSPPDTPWHLLLPVVLTPESFVALSC